MQKVIADAPPRLEYACPLARRGKRCFRRNFMVVVAVGLLAWVGWQAGPELLDRLKMLRAQRQCMAYRAPADQVVSAEPLPVLWDTSYLFARPDPACLTNFQSHPAGAALWSMTGPVVFMHERRTRRGRRRLVIVRRVPPAQRQSVDIPQSFLVALVEPGTMNARPSARTFTVVDPVSPSFPDDAKEPPALRLFAGQPDPADASRFTIGYEASGNVGEIEGLLIESETSGARMGGGLTVELRLVN